MLPSPILFAAALLASPTWASGPAVGEPAPRLGTEPALDLAPSSAAPSSAAPSSAAPSSAAPSSAPSPALSLAGRVVVLNFWASWCGPCLTELPALDALHDGLVSQGGAVVAVNLDRRRPPADKVIQRLGLDLPMVFDPEGQIALEYEPAGLPTTYLVDATGTVRAVHQGALSADQIAELGAAARALVPTTTVTTPAALPGTEPAADGPTPP
jgi:thiol-disulfide isomerase/thioredoxin